MDVYDLQRGWEKFLRWEVGQATNAGIRPVVNAPKPPNVGVLMSKGYKVKFKGNTKKTTILRFILAKSVYEEIDEADVAAIEELLLELLEKSSSEADFKVKWAQWLNTVVAFCKQAFRGKKFPRKVSEGVLAQYNDLVPFFPSKQVYFRMKPQMEGTFKIFPINPNRVLPPKRQKRVVGVGYHDKGHSRDEAYDGSPTWQELSKAHDGHLDRIRKFQSLELKAAKLRAAGIEAKTRLDLGYKKLEKAETFSQLVASLGMALSGIEKMKRNPKDFDSDFLNTREKDQIKEYRKLLDEISSKLGK